MDLGNLTNLVARNVDVLHGTVQIARWLPWAQVMAIAGAAGTLGWLARSRVYLHAAKRSNSVVHDDHWVLVTEQLEAALTRRLELAKQPASTIDLLRALAGCTDADLTSLLGTELPVAELGALRTILKERIERRHGQDAAQGGRKQTAELTGGGAP